jgi:hypothetical protein
MQMKKAFCLLPKIYRHSNTTVFLTVQSLIQVYLVFPCGLCTILSMSESLLIVERYNEWRSIKDIQNVVFA